MSQVDFFMSARDEQGFMDFALVEHGLLPFRAIQSSPEAVPCDRNSLPSISTVEGQSVYLAPRGRAAEVKYRKVPTQEYFSIEMSGPVIRWMRSGAESDGAPKRGWIYLNTERPRPPDLDLAYRRLASWIRMQCRPLPSDRAYAGPEAWELMLKTRRT